MISTVPVCVLTAAQWVVLVAQPRRGVSRQRRLLLGEGDDSVDLLPGRPTHGTRQLREGAALSPG